MRTRTRMSRNSLTGSMFLLWITLLAFAAVTSNGQPIGSVDSVTTKDGKTVYGRVLSMQDGKLNLDTAQGPYSVDLNTVSGFVLQRTSPATGAAAGTTGVAAADSAAPAFDPQALDRVLTTQQDILQRLDSLALALANLEQQLRSVQTNQVIESRRLTERTFETNPVAKVVVIGSNVVRRGNNTIVIGQVMNQSESVVTNLQVQATLIGSRGSLGNVGGSQSKTGPVLPATLGPGQVGAFEVPFSGKLLAENVQVSVIGYPGQFQIPLSVIPQAYGEY